MHSLVSLATKHKWDKCYDMLVRLKGDVHERDQVRSAPTTCTQHAAKWPLFHLCVR